MTHGWQAQATYTLARGVDNAPLTGTYVVGSGDDRVSDPSNLDRDKGVTPFNQTHTFAVSTVIAPQVPAAAPARRSLNNNQLGVIVQANSGLPFNIRSNRRSEQGRRDQRSTERSGAQRRPARHGVQPRPALLAVHPAADGQRVELFFEAKNLFNTENMAGVNRVVDHRPLGNPTSPILIDGRRLPDGGKERLRSALVAARVQVHVLDRGSGRGSGFGVRGSGSCSGSRIPHPGLRVSLHHAPYVPSSSFFAIAALVGVAPSAQLRVAPVGERPDVDSLGLMLGSWDQPARSWRPTRIPTTRTTRCWRCCSHGQGMRTVLVTATRGNGGQNEIGPEIVRAARRAAHRGAAGRASLRRRGAVLHPRDRFRLLVQHRGVDREVGTRRDRRRLRPADSDDAA